MTEKPETTGLDIRDVERMKAMEVRTKRAEQQAGTIKLDIRDYVAQVIAHLKQTRLTTDEIRELYKAITGRMVSKMCYMCGKLKVELEGEQRFIDGDMSKPKRFICKDCK